MLKELNVPCRFCGQSSIIEISEAEIAMAKENKEFADLPEHEIVVKLAEAKLVRRCMCSGASKYRKQELRRTFEGFISNEMINFMNLHELEEMSITDAYGNKAKLKRKETGIEVIKTLKDVM